jgi:hypothetical protein
VAVLRPGPTRRKITIYDWSTRGTDSGESWIGDYELEIRAPGKEQEDPKLTLRWQAK